MLLYFVGINENLTDLSNYNFFKKFQVVKGKLKHSRYLYVFNNFIEKLMKITRIKINFQCFDERFQCSADRFSTNTSVDVIIWRGVSCLNTKKHEKYISKIT